MRMLRSLVQRLKPLVTRRNLWIRRDHRVLLERWDRTMCFDVHHALAHLLLRKRPLTMVQVGACDGLLDDPVEPYIRNGYVKGLLVEPQPEAYQSLADRYQGNPHIRTENCAVAPAPGTLTMHRVKASHRHLLRSWAFGMASARPDALLAELGKVMTDPREGMETLEVEALTWQQLFDRHGITGIDFLQIDTEGLDGVLLDCFPYEQHKPALIHFEWSHLGEPDLANLFNRLMDLGYRLHLAGIDAVACQQDLVDSMPLMPASGPADSGQPC